MAADNSMAKPRRKLLTCFIDPVFPVVLFLNIGQVSEN